MTPAKGTASSLPLRRRKWTRYLAGAGVGVLVYVLLGGRTGVIELYRVRSEVRQLEVRIGAAARELDSLRTRIELLKGDTAAIERIAREELGMARSNETIFKFLEE